MEITSRCYNQVLQRLEFKPIFIAVALEVRSGEQASSFKGRIRLATIPDGSAQSIAAFVQANVKAGATLLTDGHRSYRELDRYHLDPRYHGKQLPHAQRVFASIKKWFKTDTLDRDTIDRGLEFVRAEFTPQDPQLDWRAPFETLLRLALRAEPHSKALSSRKTRGRGFAPIRKKTAAR